MPPPRGITAARPPFLPLRLDASARLGGVLGRLGGVWGASWGVLGRQKTISKTKLMLRAKMSGPQRFPKAPRKLFLEPKCDQNRSKTRSKRLLFCILFSMHFFFDLGSIFPPNLAPKNHQNRRKIRAKMPSQVDLVLGSIFDRFFNPRNLKNH